MCKVDARTRHAGSDSRILNKEARRNSLVSQLKRLFLGEMAKPAHAHSRRERWGLEHRSRKS